MTPKLLFRLTIFTMAHSLFSFYMTRSITQGKPERDLVSSVPPASVALSLLVMATQVLQQVVTFGFVDITMLLKLLMADWQLASILLRNLMQALQL